MWFLARGLRYVRCRVVRRNLMSKPVSLTPVDRRQVTYSSAAPCFLHSFGSRAAQSAHWLRQYFPGIVYGMSPQRSLLLLTPTALACGGLQSSPLISVDLRLWLRDRRRRRGGCPSGSIAVFCCLLLPRYRSSRSYQYKAFHQRESNVRR